MRETETRLIPSRLTHEQKVAAVELYRPIASVRLLNYHTFEEVLIRQGCEQFWTCGSLDMPSMEQITNVFGESEQAMATKLLGKLASYYSGNAFASPFEEDQKKRYEWKSQFKRHASIHEKFKKIFIEENILTTSSVDYLIRAFDTLSLIAQTGSPEVSYKMQMYAAEISYIIHGKIQKTDPDQDLDVDLNALYYSESQIRSQVLVDFGGVTGRSDNFTGKPFANLSTKKKLAATEVFKEIIAKAFNDVVCAPAV